MYRILVAFFATFVVIETIVVHILRYGSFTKYFIFVSHWGLAINMITSILGGIVVALWYFKPNYAGKKMSNKISEKHLHIINENLAM